MKQELALIQRVQLKDDRQAFSQLVRLHQSKVRFTLLQLTNGQDALADDLAQETFIKAYQAIKSFAAESSFATWLHRIAYNCFISFTRKRIDEPVEQLAEASYEANYEEKFHQPMLQAAVNQALLSLPIDQRAALHYSFQRGHSHGEIANIMGQPLGTIKTLINRGKIALKKTLQAWQEVDHE